MGLFDVTKTANPTDNRQAVDTEGIALQGQAVAARDEAISLGGFGTKNTLGSDLSGGQAVQAQDATVLAGFGNTNTLQTGGLKLNDNKGEITINSSEGVEAVTKTFADTVKEFLNGSNSGDTEGKPLATTTETTPETATESGDIVKPILWVIGLAITILVGLWLARRKKKTA